MFSPLTQLRLAYTGLLAMTLAAHWIDVPVHVHMLTDCILIIHIGCLSALANEPVHLGRTGKHKVVHSEVSAALAGEFAQPKILEFGERIFRVVTWPGEG